MPHGGVGVTVRPGALPVRDLRVSSPRTDMTVLRSAPRAWRG
ncbi:hypothetical protein CSE45_1087 [Citreicella sp. SE45]|nr:hypothetical protein CSE45_1087 [Citreicella sp. SE45]